MLGHKLSLHISNSHWWGLPNIVKHFLQLCWHDCPVRCWTRHLTRSRRAATSRWSATRTSTPSSSATRTRAALPATCSAPCPPSEHSTPLLTKICNPLAQGFYQKYFQQRCLWFIVTWKTFFFAFYRKYKGSFNNDVIGFGWLIRRYPTSSAMMPLFEYTQFLD